MGHWKQALEKSAVSDKVRNALIGAGIGGGVGGLGGAGLGYLTGGGAGLGAILGALGGAGVGAGAGYGYNPTWEESSSDRSTIPGIDESDRVREIPAADLAPIPAIPAAAGTEPSAEAGGVDPVLLAGLLGTTGAAGATLVDKGPAPLSKKDRVGPRGRGISDAQRNYLKDVEALGMRRAVSSQNVIDNLDVLRRARGRAGIGKLMSIPSIALALLGVSRQVGDVKKQLA